VVDADLKGYFDTIPKERLLAMVNERISDRRVLSLIKSYGSVQKFCNTATEEDASQE
jgi:retron-type reverse transcriptase